MIHLDFFIVMYPSILNLLDISLSHQIYWSNIENQFKLGQLWSKVDYTNIVDWTKIQLTDVAWVELIKMVVSRLKTYYSQDKVHENRIWVG